MQEGYSMHADQQPERPVVVAGMNTLAEFLLILLFSHLREWQIQNDLQLLLI